MAYSEAAKRATLAHRKKAGIINMTLSMMPEEREKIKAAAAARGLSAKAYIMELVEEDVKKAKQK